MRKAVVSLLLLLLPGFTATAQELRIRSFEPTGAITFNSTSNVAAYHVEAYVGDGWFPLIGFQSAGDDDLTGSTDFRAHPWMLLRVSVTENEPAPPGFSLIPAGTFTMGSPPSELGREDNETQHRVMLSRDFFLQETEVTNRQMTEVLNWAYGQGLISVTTSTVQNLDGARQELLDMDGDYCQISWDGTRLTVDEGKEDYPCIEVTWYGAQAYCNYLSDIEGLIRAVDMYHWIWTLDATGYRLPTESEWEYACRAGTTTAFYTGPISYTGSDPVDPNLDRAGWFRGNSTNPDNPISSGRGTHPVGLKEANDWGLYDMHANVWEWCGDWFTSSYPGAVTDPVGPSSTMVRVFRGGSWYFNAAYCRSASRFHDSPANSIFDIGFRPARTVVP